MIASKKILASKVGQLKREDNLKKKEDFFWMTTWKDKLKKENDL